MLGTYQFDNVNVIFGALEITGFASGDDALTITPSKEKWTKIVGCDGAVERSKSSDDSCEIVVKLIHTSPTNKKLNALFFADAETGTGVFPFYVTDKSTGTKFIISKAWIAKKPMIGLGENASIKEWMFHGSKLIEVN